MRQRTAPVPAANALTPARVAPGRMLFFDPRLSGSGLLSCASCHNPALGWQDGLPLGLGHNMARLGRHTPTILNVAWDEALMWDGRFGSLEEQALGPIASEAEMRLPLDSLVARLRAIPGYAPHFEAAYPGDGISAEVVGKALASFERTIVSADAPFDRWVAGDEAGMFVRTIGGVVRQIAELQQTIAGAVEEQTATTGEIARSIAEAARGGDTIAQGVGTVSRRMDGVLGAASQTGQVSDTVRAHATRLQELVARYRLSGDAAAGARQGPEPRRRAA